MSANTETTEGPPKGYVECPKKCGRWTFGDGMDDLAQTECWTCIDPTGEENQSAFHKDWTPPIAAPAAHIERRKGQRWKHVNSVGCVTEWTLDAYHAGNDSGWDATGRVGAQGYVMDTCWSNATITMTLLADATPEPAKACESCGGDESTCGVHGCPGGKIKTCPTCEWAMSDCACTPPAQEAPKAAPACQGGCGGMGLLHRGDVLVRVIKGRGRILACDGYMLFMGNDGAPIVGTGVLRDPAIAERLPKPQLAADWVEDCLPTAGR